MVTTLIQAPFHRHEGNFYVVDGKFKISEMKESYTIELETHIDELGNHTTFSRNITIPKTNTVQPQTSLFDLPDDLVFFPILHHDVGTFELIYIDSKEVYDRYLFT
jgi:CBS domain containing-hemolysin-like protein